MQSIIYFLFVIFMLIVQRSTSIDSYNRKDGKTNYYDDDDDDSVTDASKYDRLKDYQPQASTYRSNRYSPYGSSSNNYRSQSRWPSSYDDRSNSNDWSQYGNLLPGFPGPLPPAAFETGAYLGNGPNCYSLLDSQYPLFSDICGAVPQARYSLPNSFGHLERWQIAQVLNAILGPLTPTSASPVCTRSLRLLLCPLLFPPCPTRYETPPVLPCQPFCRVVKNQCASPSLDLLPCDLLPPTSDLCPINPTPYSSLLSSFGQPLPFNGGLLPGGFPQSPLSSLLAQSAFQSGFSPSDISPSPFPSMFSQAPYSSGFSPSDISPSPFPSMFSQSPYSSGFSPSDISPSSFPSMFSQSPYSSGFSPSDISPSPFSSSPYSQSLTPSGVPSPAFSSMFSQSPYLSALSPSDMSPLTLSSLLSSSPYSSALTPSGLPPPTLSSLLSSSGVPPTAMSSLLSPLNSLFNAESFNMAGNINPILVDFPPIQYAQNHRSASQNYRPASQNYRPASRYYPATRSATEKV